MSMRPRPCSTSRAAPSSPTFPSSPSSAPATAPPSGQKFTRQLASELGLEGFVIASGLARGIDTAAHRSALEHGTIAVVAGGIDVVYPPENEELQDAIARTRSPHQRAASRLLAARQGLSPPQSADFRNLARRGGGRGGRAFGLADHGAACRRTGTRSVRRARQPARSARRRHKQSPEARRMPRHLFARYRRDARADPGTPASRRRPVLPRATNASRLQPLPDIGRTERRTHRGSARARAPSISTS